MINGGDDDREAESWDDEQEAHADALRDMVLDYLDENEVDEGTAVFSLVNIALSIAMSGYVMSVDKPSVGGLRMALDRLGKDFADIIREAKKNADEFLTETRAALEAEDAD